MRFYAQYGNTTTPPADWATAREAEGWDGVSYADHISSQGRPWRHLFVTLATLAAVTRRVTVTSAFANNLLRSPVEFAQAALTLQHSSGGRFEAGLGAGWERSEIEALGWAYDEPPARARRYLEAVTIVRSLLADRTCRFDGEFYDVDIPLVGPEPAGPPPPLVVSLGGSWTIRHIAPLAHRVEVVAPGPDNFLRGGGFDLEALRRASWAGLREGIRRVREVNPTVPISTGVFVAVGDAETTRPIAALFEGTVFEGLAGSPEQVAQALRRFTEEDLAGVTVMPMTPDAVERLGPALFASRAS